MVLIIAFAFLQSCSNDELIQPVAHNNPEVSLNFPTNFPQTNVYYNTNKPTKYGVELGEKLFNEKKFSANNTISCATCHIQENAFADNNAKSVGIFGRIGLRNTPPIQNMAFMKFYMWDGNVLELEHQPLIPIITKEEMNSSVLDVIEKLKKDQSYLELFQKTFGDKNITQERIFKSLAQYQYTLISANSKYDKVKRNEGEVFTENEAKGYQVFNNKCASCHSGELFTDESFRNIGFPINPNTEEAGRARITGKPEDYMAYRVPSLRNIEHTAPYGSFGQFPTLKSVLDYLNNGVLHSDNLDPILKNNGNKIVLTENEKLQLIDFMKTLSDKRFIEQK